MPLLSSIASASVRGFGAFRPSTPGSFIAASGGTIYTDPTNANYRIHEFTTSGTLTVTTVPTGSTIELMMVGGGGGGLFGGGGAGGYVWRPTFSISEGSYFVGIGSGGASFSNGNSTTFAGLTAIGGGTRNSSGGSGGGGVDGSGGAALQPTSTTGGYGNAGANWTGGGFDGGGGGAGSSGFVPDGGAGRTADIISSSGTFATFAQGGWGVANSVAYELPEVVANSGNGGWGGGYDDENGNYINSSPGQDGIVRIRYRFQ